MISKSLYELRQFVILYVNRIIEIIISILREL